MAKRKAKPPQKALEVFFKESIERGSGYDHFDWLSQELCRIVGYDGYDRFSEFGSGCSAMDIFPAADAEKYYEKLKKMVGKKVAYLTVKKVTIEDWSNGNG